MARDLEFAEFFPAISKGIVIVDFFATWCGPCQRFMKIIPRLETALGDSATIVKVDVDKEPVLKQMYEIKKVPTFLFFVDGQEVFRKEGLMMTIEEIKEEVAKHVKVK